MKARALNKVRTAFKATTDWVRRAHLPLLFATYSSAQEKSDEHTMERERESRDAGNERARMFRSSESTRRRRKCLIALLTVGGALVDTAYNQISTCYYILL